MRSASNNLRFAFVSTMNGSPWGGSEQLWSDTAVRLRGCGHHVAASVFRWPSRPPRLDELARAGVQLGFRPRRPGLVARLLKRVLRDYSAAAWLRRQSPDLVVISQGGPWDGIPWMALCQRLGLPYCTIVHAHGELWWPLDEHLDAIRIAFASARQIFFVSHANRKLMELQCGSFFPNAEVVANPCKVDRTTPVPWPVADGRFHLACVGRIAPAAKGQDLLLQVLAQARWKNRPVTLHFYGTGPAQKSVESLAALLGVNTVVFHGHVTDVREIWRVNHVLVLPSRFEGLPLTIVEAMISGRPVITTSVAGNTELVEDNDNGFVAAAPTVELLDEAMERAWSRREEWKALGDRARGDALAFAPEDPVGDFAGKLLNLAGVSSTEPVSRPALPSQEIPVPVVPAATRSVIS